MIGARGAVAAAGLVAAAAFALALGTPAGPPDGQLDEGAPLAAPPVEDANEAVEPVAAPVTGDGPSLPAGAAARAPIDDGTMLADAPHELLAYTVACGDLRAVEPDADPRVYRLEALGEACAAGWTPDGRLAVMGPASRSSSAVAGLRLVGRDGTAETLAVSNRSVSGTPAFWADGAVDVCVLTRRAPYRPSIWRQTPGGRPRLVADGCFPSVSPAGLLAYATGNGDTPVTASVLRTVKVVDRTGRERLSVAIDGTIIDLAWSGDGSRVVAVAVDDGTSRVLAIDDDGAITRLAQTQQGSLSIYPAPTGRDLAIVRTRPDAVAQVSVVNARTGGQQWYRWTHGVTRVVWRPEGGLALIADGVDWQLVTTGDGQIVSRVPRLGDEPAWCCPTAGPS